MNSKLVEGVCKMDALILELIKEKIDNLRQDVDALMKAHSEDPTAHTHEHDISHEHDNEKRQGERREGERRTDTTAGPPAEGERRA